MRILRNERGMVLLLVLLVVALLAALLAELSFSTLVDMRLAETFRDSTRASYLARGGLQVGQMLLQDDKNAYDGLDELWAIGVQQYPVADGSVTIEIVDLDGRVALNQLVLKDGVSGSDIVKRRYLRLLEELEAENPEALAEALMDWIDTDSDQRPGGAESAVYSSRAEPYQCKNGPLDTLDELALVEGYTPELLSRLRPHVTAYGSEKVNINTASREVLLALSDDMDDAAVETIIAARQEQPFTALTQVRDLPEMDILYGSFSLNIELKSNRFQVTSTGLVNDGRSTLLGVVAKDTNKILFQRVL